MGIRNQPKTDILPHPRLGQRHLLIVIPARDEEKTVAQVVADARTVSGAAIVVVDDGSSDQTADRARAAGAIVLSLPVPMGAWGAIQAGMRYAIRHGFRTVLTMDADGQHHARSIPNLTERIDTGELDVVIGACPQRLSLAKRIAWSYFRFITGLAIQDFTSGFRIYGPRSLRVLASRRASLLDYQDVGVLMLMRRQGLRVGEVPVAMSPRVGTRSRVFSSWFVVARYMLHTTVLAFAQTGAKRIRRAPS